jgi:hypothetical protein
MAENRESRERVAQDLREEEERDSLQREEERDGGKQHNGKKHANQYTKGRNDDRPGREN